MSSRTSSRSKDVLSATAPSQKLTKIGTKRRPLGEAAPNSPKAARTGKSSSVAQARASASARGRDLASSARSIRPTSTRKKRDKASAATPGGRTPGRRTARTPGSTLKPEVSSDDAAAVSESAISGLPSFVASVDEILDGDLDESYAEDYRRLLKMPLVTKDAKWDMKKRESRLKDLVRDLRVAVSDFVSRKQRLREHAASVDDRLSGVMRAAAARSRSLEEEHAAALSMRSDLESRITALESERDGAQGRADAAEASARSARDRALESGAKEQEAIAEAETLRDEMSTLEARLASQQRKLAEAESREAKILQELDEFRSTKEEQEASLRREQERIQQEAKEEILAKEKLRAAASKRADEVAAKFAQLEQDLATQRQEVQRLQVVEARFEATSASAAETRENLQKELEAARQQLRDKEASVERSLALAMQSQKVAADREEESSRRAKELEGRVEDLRSKCGAAEERCRQVEEELRGAKSRGEEASAEVVRLGGELSSAKERLAVLGAEKERLESELREVKDKAAKDAAEAKETKENLEGQLADALAAKTSAEESLASLTEAHETLETKLREVETEKESIAAAAADRLEKLEALDAELDMLKRTAGVSHSEQLTQLLQASKKVKALEMEVERKGSIEERLAEAEERQKQLQDDLFRAEMTRRDLHNRIQDLKGNVRVAVRVRPILSSDGGSASASSASSAAAAAAEEGDDEVVEEDDFEEDFDEENAEKDDNEDDEFAKASAGAMAVSCGVDGRSIRLRAASGASRGRKAGHPGASSHGSRSYGFEFDNVFGTDATQADVFEEVSQLVQSALDGYQVCLFSYGQTGSGKTHTMQGGSGADAGLIPRSVHKILQTAAELERTGWSYTLKASMLEIYNENIRDLLVQRTDDTPASLPIHTTKDGATDVPGLTRETIASSEDVERLLRRAASRRAVAATDMNDVSSRSHSVFTLYLRGENRAKKVVVTGSLNLCDLAGSERVNRSGATGQRMKEAQNINKSLSCLADVFTALAANKPHIPFRNSKLTRLLQRCFQGDGKTMMFVNLSPTAASAPESLCSLRFASQVSQVHLGRATAAITASTSSSSSSSDAPENNTLVAPPPIKKSIKKSSSSSSSISKKPSSASAAAAEPSSARPPPPPKATTTVKKARTRPVPPSSSKSLASSRKSATSASTTKKSISSKPRFR